MTRCQVWTEAWWIIAFLSSRNFTTQKNVQGGKAKSDGRNQVTRKLLINSSLLAAVKWFATTKEKVGCSEEQDELKTSLGFVVVKLSFATSKRFTKTKPLFTAAKEGSNIDTTTFRGEVLGKWFLS